MKKLLLLAFAAFALAACTDDDNWQDPQGPDPEPPVIPPVTPPADNWTVYSFEASEGWCDLKGAPALPGDIEVVGGAVAGSYPNVFWANSPDYPTEEVQYMGNVYDGVLVTSKDGSVAIGSYYSDGTGWGSGRMDTWGGFVVSKNFNRTASSLDLKNHFSAWTEKGAGGSETFLAAYDFSMMGGTYSAPKIVFTMPRTVTSLCLANSTALYPYESSKSDFYFTVRVTGYDAAGKLLGEVDCPLFTDGKKADDWVEVSTERFGAVSSLKFKVVSNDAMAPTYFCLDHLKVKEHISISFEAAEGLKDIEGGVVEPGEITMAGAAVSQTYPNVYWAKSFSNYADYLVDGAYDGYLCSTVDENFWFGTYFKNTDYGDQWGGFVLTENYAKTATELDYADQFTVWAEAGADGCTCLIGYEDTYTGGYACPKIEIAGAPVVFRHCYLANTALTHSYSPTQVAASAYYYKVIVKGWLEGEQTGSVECLLVDGTKKLEGWQWVDLRPLGKVDCLSFSTDTNDRNNYGPMAPAYFALDGIGYFPAK